MDVQEARVEFRRIEVEDLLAAVGSLQFSEVLLRKIHNHLVLHVSRRYDYHIFAVVHPLVEADDHVPGNLVDVVDLPENRQAHHVVPVHVEVNIFHQRFKTIIVGRLQLLPNRIFFKLYVESLIKAIAEHVAQDIYSMRNIIFEGKHVIKCELPTRVRIQLIAPILNFGFKPVSRPPLGALEVQMLQEVGLTGILNYFVPGPGVDEYTYSSYF